VKCEPANARQRALTAAQVDKSSEAVCDAQCVYRKRCIVKRCIVIVKGCIVKRVHRQIIKAVCDAQCEIAIVSVKTFESSRPGGEEQ